MTTDVKPFCFGTGSITHPFPDGSRVRACRLVLAQRPLFFDARVERAVSGFADLYLGHASNDTHPIRFYAHPECFQSHQAEAALIMQFLAMRDPARFIA